MSDDAASDDKRALERGRLLFARPCEFKMGVAKLEQLPSPELPEICFAGRSNVGKSSLLNALTGRKALARTSDTPGRTQEINFFTLGDALTLVDLPGYGYARVSNKKVKAWTKMKFDYLRGRPNLRRVCLLIDARRGVKDADEEVMKMLDTAAVSFQIILTKTDKLKVEELDALRAATDRLARKHPAAHPELMETSSRTGVGLPELRASLATFADGFET